MSNPSSPIRIFLASDLMEQVKSHAATSPNKEVGGVLVGSYQPNANIQKAWDVHVYASLPAQHTINKHTSVQFTAESWSTALDEIETNYTAAHFGQDLVMVGWYHTHPGFGIFFSGDDLFIHENYFSEPWQIALVVDPNADSFGFFVWSDRTVTTISNDALGILEQNGRLVSHPKE